MQQKDISVTKNPQIDISETPEGHLIAYFARYGILRPYILYILHRICVYKGRDLPEATEMTQADPLMSPHNFL